MTTTAAPPFRASRYTTGAILLHWTIALLVLVQLAGGWAMTNVLPEGAALQFQLYQLHKSVGVTVLVLTVARILWRAFNPPPPEPASVGRLERIAAHTVHLAFYVLLLAIPLSGWLLVTVSPVQIDTVLFFVDRLPWPHLPGFGGMADGTRARLTEATEEVHTVLAYAAGVLVALHVAGALKHHLADGHYLRRMSPAAGGGAARKAYGTAATSFATVVFFGAMVGAATLARQSPEVAGTPVAATPEPTAALDAAAPADAPEEIAAPAPAASPAPLWTVDPARSRLAFTVDFDGRLVEGRFERLSPTIRFDPDNLDGSSLAVEIDTASGSTGPGITARQLTGDDGFAVASFPAATFRSDVIRRQGEGYAAEGELTIRDRAVPLTLPFTVAIDGDSATATGSVTLDRTAFGIGTTNDAQGTTLGKDVVVSLEIAATRSGAAESAPVTRAPPGVWTVVPGESAVGFAFDFQGRRVAGDIGTFSPEIRFDEDDLPNSSIDVDLDLSSARVEGTAVTENQLRGPDGFAVAADPVARFRSETIERAGDGRYLAKGELTLRGVSQPVDLPFTLEVVDGRGTAEATARLDRLAFGVGAQNDPAGSTISSTIEISVRIVASAPDERAAALR